MDVRRELLELMGWIEMAGTIYSGGGQPLFVVMDFNEWDPVDNLDQLTQCQNRIMELGLTNQYYDELKKIVTAGLEDYEFKSYEIDEMEFRATPEQQCRAMANTWRNRNDQQKR